MKKKNEIILSLSISKFNDISHDEISDLIGKQPTLMYVKGKKMRENSPRTAKENVWFLDAPPGKYAPFEEQMNALLDIIEERIDVFKKLTNKYYCEFSCALFIYIGNGESTPWVHLNSRYNKLMKEVNIEFDLDLYCWDI